MADEYVGYLPSSYNIGYYDAYFSGNIYSGSVPITKLVVQDYANNMQSMIKVQTVPLIADFIPLTFTGTSAVTNSKYISDDFREIEPIRMVKIDTVPLQADFVPLPFTGLDHHSGTSIVGLKTNAEFSGVLPGMGDTQIEYVYRTVGSPRRTPLESSWIRSKNEEPIIIDEVDGDVDE